MSLLALSTPKHFAVFTSQFPQTLLLKSQRSYQLLSSKSPLNVCRQFASIVMPFMCKVNSEVSKDSPIANGR